MEKFSVHMLCRALPSHALCCLRLNVTTEFSLYYTVCMYNIDTHTLCATLCDLTLILLLQVLCDCVKVCGL